MTPIFDDPMMVRQVILDHYQYPRNKELTHSCDYCSKRMNSDSCIDDITIEMLLVNGKIEDIRFDGVACAISTASTSIMTELLKGKTKQEADVIINEYLKMINEEEYDEEILQEAAAFKNTGKQANRIKCATIGWLGAKEILEEKE